jgi:ankyrin repeat protein/L-ascorbate metabolism protein UlaG (beta-lactamase superfamily)
MKNRACFSLIALAFVLAAAGDQGAQTTIFEAAQSGDLETAARLLKADPKLAVAKNDQGDTALHQAAGCRRGEEAGLPIVRLLLESGADVNARNSGNQTPILYSAYAGFRRLVELLLEKGASFQYQDSNGRSPLHYAAREGRAAVVEMLINKGADPSLKDNQGLTPLDYALQRSQKAVLETMMKLIPYDAKGPEGSGLLHAAASLGNEDMVRSLLEKGADPNRPSPSGEPILLSYLRGGMAARAVDSIAKGADVNAKDAAGRPALHLAVEKGLDEAVKALLDKGADPNAADGDGLTGLEIAEDWGSGALVSLLTARGARPVRPKVYALKGGSHEVVEPPAGARTETAVIRYIGTDGFLIQAGGRSVLVDGLVRNPWGYTNTPERALALMKGRKPPFDKLDLLLFSHAHRDHFEPRMALDVLAAQPGAVLVGDGLVEKDLLETGTDEVKKLGPRVRILGLKVGERTNLEANGIPLTVLGVNHADREPAYLTLGYIMDLGPFRIYHQGDLFPDANMAFLASIPWEEMKIDIAFFDPFFLQNDASRKIVLDRIRPSAVILMHMRDDEGERYYSQLKTGVPQVLYYRGPMESKRFVKASALSRRP